MGFSAKWRVSAAFAASEFPRFRIGIPENMSCTAPGLVGLHKTQNHVRGALVANRGVEH